MCILICDDDPLITDYLLKQSEIELSSMEFCARILTFSTGESLLQYLQKNTADLLFLDISLNSMNGIAIARQLNKICPALRIVYITGYTEFAGEICLSRYENFLLKPIEPAKFHVVFRQAIKEIELGLHYIRLKIGATPISLDTRKIIYIESDKRKIILHCTDTTIQYYYKLTDMLSLLPKNFAQCHKSYIVNLDYIQSIHHNEVFLKNSLCLPIAQKRQDFKIKFIGYLGV